MSCSPIRLFMDSSFWAIRLGLGIYVEDFLNISRDGTPDCALVSVPCESAIVQAVYSFDEDFVYWFDLIVVYILSTLVISMGLVTNIINIIIFSKYRIAGESTNCFLLGLAVSDFLSLVVNALINLSAFLCFVDVAMALTTYNLVISSYDIYRYINLLSLDFVTAMSIQRAALVLFPFKVGSMFTKSNTKKIIAALTVLSIAEMIPTRIFLIPLWYFHPFFNKSLSLGFKFTVNYHTYVDYALTYTNFRGVLGLVLIFISVSLTVVKLNLLAKNRASMRGNNETPEGDGSSTTKNAGSSKISSREARVVKMSLSVCFVTFLIYSFAYITNQALQDAGGVFYESTLPSMAVFLQMLLLSLNSSYNFFLYIVMSDKYRVVFKNLLSPSAIRESEYFSQFTTRG